MECVVVRALSSQQCDPDSNPGVEGTEVFSGYSGLPVSSKSNIYKFQFDTLFYGWATSKRISYLLFIY